MKPRTFYLYSNKPGQQCNFHQIVCSWPAVLCAFVERYKTDLQADGIQIYAISAKLSLDVRTARNEYQSQKDDIHISNSAVCIWGKKYMAFEQAVLEDPSAFVEEHPRPGVVLLKAIVNEKRRERKLLLQENNQKRQSGVTPIRRRKAISEKHVPRLTLQQQVTQLKGEIRSLQAQFAEIMGGAKGNQWRLPAEYWVIPAIDIDKAEVTPKVKPKAMSPKKKSEKATPKKKVTKAAPKIEGAVKKTSRKKVVAKAVPKKKEVAKATPRKRPTGQPLMPLKKIRAKVSCHLPVDAHEKEWIPSVGEKVAGKKRRSLDNYRRSSDPSMQEQKERDMLGIDIDGRVYLQKRKKGAVFFYKKTVVPGSTDFKEFHAVID